MSSGKISRVVISCVTFEVAKITQPAIFYEATRVHLIHYGGDVYNEFYKEVYNDLKKALPNVDIREYEEPVSDFKKMLSTVLMIIEKEKLENREDGVEIYVNISAGTSEYSAASLLASMMIEGVSPFNVSAEEYQVPKTKIRDVYYENGRPVGLTRTCKEPVKLSTYAVQRPDMKLVLGLKVLKDIIDAGGGTTAPEVIKGLTDAGLINCEYVDSKRKEGHRKPNQNTVMSYQRNYLNQWLDKKYVVRMSKRSIKITELGLNVIDVFWESYDFEFRNYYEGTPGIF